MPGKEPRIHPPSYLPPPRNSGHGLPVSPSSNSAIAESSSETRRIDPVNRDKHIDISGEEETETVPEYERYQYYQSGE